VTLDFNEVLFNWSSSSTFFIYKEEGSVFSITTQCLIEPVSVEIKLLIRFKNFLFLKFGNDSCRRHQILLVIKLTILISLGSFRTICDIILLREIQIRLSLIKLITGSFFLEVFRLRSRLRFSFFSLYFSNLSHVSFLGVLLMRAVSASMRSIRLLENFFFVFIYRNTFRTTSLSSCFKNLHAFSN
jgi:hypothetical protein